MYSVLRTVGYRCIRTLTHTRDHTKTRCLRHLIGYRRVLCCMCTMLYVYYVVCVL